RAVLQTELPEEGVVLGPDPAHQRERRERGHELRHGQQAQFVDAAWYFERERQQRQREAEDGLAEAFDALGRVRPHPRRELIAVRVRSNGQDEARASRRAAISAWPCSRARSAAVLPSAVRSDGSAPRASRRSSRARRALAAAPINGVS